MAKRIALLISLVMMLSFSCVFATETIDAAAPAQTEVVEVVSGDESETPADEISDVEVSGEVADTEEVSGEAEVEAPVSGEETETPADTVETEEGNGSVLAAVIAIVVVVAIVAIVCVLKKK